MRAKNALLSARMVSIKKLSFGAMVFGLVTEKAYPDYLNDPYLQMANQRQLEATEQQTRELEMTRNAVEDLVALQKKSTSPRVSSECTWMLVVTDLKSGKSSEVKLREDEYLDLEQDGNGVNAVCSIHPQAVSYTSTMKIFRSSILCSLATTSVGSTSRSTYLLPPRNYRIDQPATLVIYESKPKTVPPNTPYPLAPQMLLTLGCKEDQFHNGLVRSR